MQTKEIISSIYSCVHKTVYRLSWYMNIPKYSKLFIQIVQETSVRESDCPGNVRYPTSYANPNFSGGYLMLEVTVTRAAQRNTKFTIRRTRLSLATDSRSS